MNCHPPVLWAAFNSVIKVYSSIFIQLEGSITCSACKTNTQTHTSRSRSSQIWLHLAVVQLSVVILWPVQRTHISSEALSNMTESTSRMNETVAGGFINFRSLFKTSHNWGTFLTRRALHMRGLCPKVKPQNFNITLLWPHKLLHVLHRVKYSLKTYW